MACQVMILKPKTYKRLWSLIILAIVSLKYGRKGALGLVGRKIDVFRPCWGRVLAIAPNDRGDLKKRRFSGVQNKLKIVLSAFVFNNLWP